VDWADCGEVMAGTGAEIELALDCEYEEGGTPERMFWRVVIADEDPDGDTLTTWEELQLSLNPNHFDTDGDGLSDNLDGNPWVNGFTSDPDGLGLVPSLANGLIGRWDFETKGPNGGFESTPVAIGACDIGNTGAAWDGEATWPGLYQGFPRAALHLTGPAFLEPHGKLPGPPLSSSTQSVCMWVRFEAGTLDSDPSNRALVSWIQNYNATDQSSLPSVAALVAGNQIKFVSGRIQPVPLTEITPLASLTIPASIDLDDGEWHSLVLEIYDGGSQGVYSAWIDTVSVGSASSNQVDFHMDQGSNSVVSLGKFRKNYLAGYSRTLQATVDRLRFYNRRTTPAERSSLFNQDVDGDGLYDRTEIRKRFWKDENRDGLKLNLETQFALNPLYFDPAESDHDSDGLTSLWEQAAPGLDPASFDSDGDLFPDGWEVVNGLNPVVFNDGSNDSDGDGLSDFDEWVHGTRADIADTDDDDTNDGTEVAGGSDPTDGADGGGAIPQSDLAEVSFRIGDESGSSSERWNMLIKGTDPEIDQRELRVASTQFGEAETRSLKLRRGGTYEIELQHVATNRGEEGPDYDWDAQIGGLPTSQVLSPVSGEEVFLLQANGCSWLVDNRDGLLGVNDGGDTEPEDFTKGLVAKLIPVHFKVHGQDVPGPDKVHAMNVETRQDEAGFYGSYKKCVGHVWSSQWIDLIPYLQGADDPELKSFFQDHLKWKSNGTELTLWGEYTWQLNFVGEPAEDSLARYNIEVLDQAGSTVADRLILTVVPQSTKVNFDAWYAAESVDKGWLNELPPMFWNIETTVQPDGFLLRPDRNFNPYLYAVPHELNTRFHPDAYYEHRIQIQTAGGHGHQVCFDEQGAVILFGVSGGSADRAAAFPARPTATPHVNQDVTPFLWALQLDGNPAEQDFTTLTAPILHEGVYIERYLECRPAVPTATTNFFAPGHTP